MNLNNEELLFHFNQVGNRILEHRYRYYILNENVISDFEYDYLERYYKEIASKLNLPDTALDMVGFDITKPGAFEAKQRVDNNQDNYSLWIVSMKPIWERIHLPRKQRKLKT